MNIVEQRKEERIEVSLEIRNNEDGSIIGTIKNVTTVGAFITGMSKDSLPAVGSSVTVAFDLPAFPEEIISKAKVMWHNIRPDFTGMGILFFSMDDKHFASLQDFVERERIKMKAG